VSPGFISVSKAVGIDLTIASLFTNRYNNTAKIGDKDLILNTEIYNHQFVNREAIVKSIPTAFETEIKPGDTVVIHHNVFRRWHNQYGVEKNSKSFFNENTYLVKEDQIFLYKRKSDWKPLRGYCFVKPIKNNDLLSEAKEKPLTGVLKYLGSDLKSFNLNNEDIVGFTPNSEYEFLIDGERLYRIPINSISIKYERAGTEVEYNPSWL
jgi:hypothetical protein